MASPSRKIWRANSEVARPLKSDGSSTAMEPSAVVGAVSVLLIHRRTPALSMPTTTPAPHRGSASAGPSPS